MERILALLDGSENAEQVLPHVELLGQKMDLPVTLLRICAPGEADARPYLARLAARLAGRGIETKVQSLEAPGRSRVSETVLPYATKNDVTMIALVTHGRAGITREFCGATAKDILNQSTLPVMLVRTQPAAERVGDRHMPDGVLVPLDGSTLGERALPVAEKLARRMRGDLILLRVGEPDYDVFNAEYARGARSPAEKEAKARAEASEYLTRVADGIRARRRAKVSTDILLGAPNEAIVKRASQADIGLVVMSTHGRTGLLRVIFGSVAGYVLGHAPVPVVLVRPQ